MKYSIEVLKLGSDPRIPLEEKMVKAKDLIETALRELNTILFFIENVMLEAVEATV